MIDIYFIKKINVKKSFLCIANSRSGKATKQGSTSNKIKNKKKNI